MDQTPTTPPVSVDRVKGFSSGARLDELCRRAEAQGVLHQEFYYDHAEDKSVILTAQDLTGSLNYNREVQNDGIYGDHYSPSRDMQHVARIDPIVLEIWKAEGFDLFDRDKDWKTEIEPELKRRLNDTSNLALRTGGGVI